MSSALSRDLLTRLDAATHPTSLPASGIVAAVLVVMLLGVFSMAVRWSVSDIGRAQAAAAHE